MILPYSVRPPMCFKMYNRFFGGSRKALEESQQFVPARFIEDLFRPDTGIALVTAVVVFEVSAIFIAAPCIMYNEQTGHRPQK